MEQAVLIVDDESHIRRVLSLQLGRSGYKVEVAADGAEAIEMVRENLPDLVITDYHMPRVNGLELCESLAADDRTRDIPVVLLTANGYSIDEKMLRARVNVVQLLCKPFGPKELLDTVEEALRWRRKS